MAQDDQRLRNILWVENDIFHIRSLLHWIGKNPKYKLDTADSLTKATELVRSKSLDHYSLIVLDLLMTLRDDEGRIPDWYIPSDDNSIRHDTVAKWHVTKEEPLGANGLHFLRFLRSGLQTKCPVLIMSIVDDPIKAFDLHTCEPVMYLAKTALQPSVVTKTIESILNIPN